MSLSSTGKNQSIIPNTKGQEKGGGGMSHTIEIPWDERARIQGLGADGIKCIDFDLF
jgi:hypothetical protein